MAVGPCALRVVGPDDIESRCQSPLAVPVHQKGDIARVVILITGHNIEDHAPEHLPHGRMAEIELLDNTHSLLVPVLAGCVEIIMCHGAERLHVNLSTVRITVNVIR